MRVLIVEDETDTTEAISFSLRFHWPDAAVVAVENGLRAIEAARAEHFDLVMLDLNLPGIDGFQVLREVRASSLVPIMVISARHDEIDKVRGLELGADDYITKPFSHLELLARVKAVLRRVDMPPPGVSATTVFYDGYLGIDFESRQVTVRGERVYLTPIEYNLLVCLARNPGQVLTHQVLLQRVWGPEYLTETDYLRVYVRRLREKIEPEPEHPRYLLTERGVGYRFKKPEPVPRPEAGRAPSAPLPTSRSAPVLES